jgi:hypothetical protein
LDARILVWRERHRFACCYHSLYCHRQPFRLYLPGDEDRNSVPQPDDQHCRQPNGCLPGSVLHAYTIRCFDIHVHWVYLSGLSDNNNYLFDKRNQLSGLRFSASWHDLRCCQPSSFHHHHGFVHIRLYGWGGHDDGQRRDLLHMDAGWSHYRRDLRYARCIYCLHGDRG